MKNGPPISATGEGSLGDLVVAVFNRWRSEGIAFLVLRNYENLPEDTTNDIDVLVSPEQLAEAESLLVEAAREAGYHLHNRVEFSPVSLFFFRPQSLTQVQVDLFHNLEWRTLRLLSVRAVLDWRIERGLFAVSHPVHEAVTCLLTRQIYHGYVKEGYKPKIQETTRIYPEEVRTVFRRMFGRNVAVQLTQAILQGDWTRTERLTRAMRWQLVWRRLLWLPLSTVILVWNDLKRFAGRWLRPPGISIVLLGADGSGKSTVADGLSERLHHTFKPDKSLRVHWKPAVFLRRRRAERPLTTEPHRHPPRGGMASLLVLAYHWLEFLAGAVLQFHPALFRNGLVLIDRYHYDFEVDPRRYRLQVAPGVVRHLFRLLPQPDLVFLLDAPPEVLQARKREVTLDETRRQREAYRVLAARLPNAKIIDCTQSVEFVVRDIASHVLEYLERRQENRRGSASRPSAR
jgi:thymidylate kinase